MRFERFVIKRTAARAIKSDRLVPYLLDNFSESCAAAPLYVSVAEAPKAPVMVKTGECDESVTALISSLDSWWRYPNRASSHVCTHDARKGNARIFIPNRTKVASGRTSLAEAITENFIEFAELEEVLSIARGMFGDRLIEKMTTSRHSFAIAIDDADVSNDTAERIGRALLSTDLHEFFDSELRPETLGFSVSTPKGVLPGGDVWFEGPAIITPKDFEI